MASFHLEVVTPTGSIFAGNVEAFQAPGVDGRFGVLPRHIPYITALGVGELNFAEDAGERHRMAISGGFVEVLRTGATALAETAEFAHEIDVERAQLARDRALERLGRRSDADIDLVRAEAALTRALNRLRTVERSGV